jgi:endonuclease YncB( thermonuclease family)
MIKMHKKRWFWRAGAWSALAVGCHAAAVASPDAGAWLARVSYVVDGDSLWVRDEATQTRIKLRLEGVDAPEICQTGGKQARSALQALVLAQRVRVEVHAHDQWGRAVARVQRVDGGQDVAVQMVRSGWAWADRWRRHGALAQVQEEARRGARGVFAQPDAEYPADFRRRHGPCV